MLEKSNQTVGLGVKLPVADAAEFVRKFGGSLSRGGIYLRSKRTVAPGTRVRLELKLADGSPLLCSPGRVEFVTSGVSGMGIRFVEMPEEARRFVDGIARQLPHGEMELPPVPEGVGPVDRGEQTALELVAASSLLTSGPAAAATVPTGASSAVVAPVSACSSESVASSVRASARASLPVVAPSSAAAQSSAASGASAEQAVTPRHRDADLTTPAVIQPTVAAWKTDSVRTARPAKQPAPSSHGDFAVLSRELGRLRASVRATWLVAAVLGVASFFAGRAVSSARAVPEPVVIQLPAKTPAPELLTAEEQRAIDMAPAFEDELTAAEIAAAQEVLAAAEEPAPVQTFVLPAPVQKSKLAAPAVKEKKATARKKQTLVASNSARASDVTKSSGKRRVDPRAEADGRLVAEALASGRGSKCKARFDAVTEIVAKTKVAAHREAGILLRARCFSDTWRSLEAKNEFGRYLREFPKGKFADEARRVLAN